MEGREREQKVRDSTVGLKCTAKKSAPPPVHPPSVEDRTVKGAQKAGPVSLLAASKTQQEETKTQGTSELSSPCARVTEGSSRPVPAPRRMLDPSVAPVPVPRTKAPPRNSSPALGNVSNQKKCSSNSSHITSPTRDRPKVQTNHPWMNIIHPGPWTQLPPAPPPIPAPRSKSVSNMRRSWNRPRVPPPNPFGEEVDEDTPKESEPDDQTEASSGKGGTRKNTSGDADAEVCSSEEFAIKSTSDDVGASSEPARETCQLVSDLDETGNTKAFPPDVTEAAAAAAAGEAAQSNILPRSLSVPAIASARSQSPLLHLDLSDADQVVSCRSKLAFKENPFDRKPAMATSKTIQDLPSTRAPAPGHGFPLIKRKLQTDQNVSTEELQVEMRELEKHLEALEQKGVELEGNLRDLKNDEDEEQMLMAWFSLIHERHVLMRRDTELVHLTKEQKLEERQADVEYELRCLLNKPVSEWSREDRGREQQLMDELVAIIRGTRSSAAWTRTARGKEEKICFWKP
uniref:BMERB domain-containing protein n=1 Tax=Cyclopterus lumpus TaxID=8103 RepID=A0A8C3ARC7_CYCLU